MVACFIRCGSSSHRSSCSCHSRKEHMMITSTRSIERRPDGVFSAAEQQALVGFLGGYSGLTRDPLRPGPPPVRSLVLATQLASFDVARHDIERFARQLEDIG